MSYCRISEDCDVYVIGPVEGAWKCVGCSLTPCMSATFSNRRDIYNHLVAHYFAKDKVPDYVLKRFIAEMKAEIDSIKAKWTPEEAEALLVELGVYYGEPVKPIGRYCAAFQTWQKAVDQGAAQAEEGSQAKLSLQEMSKAIREASLSVSKSNLLSRLLYGGEKLRTEPCPIHKGHWSGCAWGDGECPHCMDGANVTGWMKSK